MERLKAPAAIAEPTKDITVFISLRQSSQQISEQLLPDFYCEHITLAMNRERRKQVVLLKKSNHRIFYVIYEYIFAGTC